MTQPSRLGLGLAPVEAPRTIEGPYEAVSHANRHLHVRQRGAIQPGMQPYRNPTSGVTAFALHPHAIDVEFRDGKRFRYDAVTPGAEHVAAMRRLARSGRGLATYINQHVRERFAGRLPPRPRPTSPPLTRP